MVPGEEVARFHHGYAHEGRNVDLYVAYFTRQPPLGQADSGKRELFNGKRRAALVAVSSEQAGGSETASTAMAAFLAAAP